MKQIRDFKVTAVERTGDGYALLSLSAADSGPLPECRPGQFVQVAVDAPGVFLRRPISINSFDIAAGTLTLLVRDAGRGTHQLVNLSPGHILNLILPLGNSFTVTDLDAGKRVLLVGGGVGVAPMYCLGRELKAAGITPEFLLGARTADMLLLVDEFSRLGNVNICTDDGSRGVRGVVTDHEVISRHFDRIYCCGPSPMMKAVAQAARRSGTDCEVSLENMMACGLGACLCCVEKTVKGNVCVCTEGPVFNISQLTW